MTTIKDRVLYIAEIKKVKKEDFFSDLGLSYANFKGVQKKSALSSDSIVSILSKYSDISPDWLLFGTGPTHRANESKTTEDGTNEALKKLVASQEKTIKLLEEQLEAERAKDKSTKQPKSQSKSRLVSDELIQKS